MVLVGYQAEDPPVKYLLQGLNHDDSSDRSNLYAFDKGCPRRSKPNGGIEDKGQELISEKSYYMNDYIHKLERYANERVVEYIIFDHDKGIQRKYDGNGRFIAERQLEGPGRW